MSNEALATENDIHLDSLPYIDGDFSDLTDTVENMIREEMQRGDKNAVQIPLPEHIELFESNTILSTDLDRTSKGQQTTIMDTTRFRLEPPKTPTLDAWHASLQNSQSQLEHQSNRLINLELVNKFGPNAWRLHCFQLEWMKNSLEKEVGEVKKSVVDINKERKSEQMKTGQTLQSLTYKYGEALQRTIQVDAATRALKSEVEALRAEKERLEGRRMDESGAGDAMEVTA